MLQVEAQPRAVASFKMLMVGRHPSRAFLRFCVHVDLLIDNHVLLINPMYSDPEYSIASPTQTISGQRKVLVRIDLASRSCLVLMFSYMLLIFPAVSTFMFATESLSNLLNDLFKEC